MYSVDDQPPITNLDGAGEFWWTHGSAKKGDFKVTGFATIGSKSPGYCRRRRAHVPDAWHQRSYSLDSIGPHLDKLVRSATHDTYATQATFIGPGRKLALFSRVNSAWVDLDLYNADETACDWDRIKLSKIRSHAKALGLPAPSLIISSGRGAYAKWVFTGPVYELPAWQLVNRRLTSLFASLEADAKAQDASRVLRLVGTTNTKNDAPVEILDGCGREYDFSWFAKTVNEIYDREIGPHLSPSGRRAASTAGRRIAQAIEERAARGDTASLQLYSMLRTPVCMERLSQQSLNWARFCDLRDLTIARGGIAQGERDQCLLWMTNCLAHARVISSANWDDEIGSLLVAFPGEDFRSVAPSYLASVRQRLSVTEAAAKSSSAAACREHFTAGLYRPSNNFLIDAFAINAHEQQALRTIIGPQEKARRRSESRDKKDPGRADRRNQRKSWQSSVQDQVRRALHARSDVWDVAPTPAELGLNISQMSRELCVDRANLTRFVRKVVVQIRAEISGDTAPEKADAAPADAAPADAALLAQVSVASSEASTPMLDPVDEVGIEAKARFDGSWDLAIKARFAKSVEALKLRSSHRPDQPDSSPFNKSRLQKEHDMNTRNEPPRATDEPPPPRSLRPGSLAAIGLGRQGSQAPARPIATSGRALGLASPARGAASDAASAMARPFYSPPPKRPRAMLVFGNPAIPQCSSLLAGEWEAAAEGARYLVFEIQGGPMDGIVRVLNPAAAQDQPTGHDDIYGKVLAAPPDDADRRALAALAGCTLIADKTLARAHDTIEDAPCRFFGHTYFVCRPPVRYVNSEFPRTGIAASNLERRDFAGHGALQAPFVEAPIDDSLAQQWLSEFESGNDAPG